MKNQSGGDDSWMTHSIKDTVEYNKRNKSIRKEQQKVNTHTQILLYYLSKEGMF